ncbi:McrB family protein [Sutcliffiella horikoshii]|uniref:McrB family protein n=1 Tax=Sutcliffiella horikoshii TaxID=79883 RepID=UPI003850E12D
MEKEIMDISRNAFEVFDRDNFIYRVNSEGATQIKEEYVSAWNHWKECVESSLRDSGCENLAVENTEHWQNSGNLRRRFWSRIKGKTQLDKPSCIAEMISKEDLRVYLEWHAYKNGNLYEERETHNSWIFSIDEWIVTREIDTSEYKIWTNKDPDEEYANYNTLEDFINDETVNKRFLEVLKNDKKSWLRIGKIYTKEFTLEHEDITKEMGDTILNLEWIYNKATELIPIKNSAGNLIEETKNEKDFIIDMVREQSDNFLTNTELINHIYSYIKSKGFYYTKEEVINLFLSIKTKPFVILSGISGTGKTKIVQWFAESVGATEDNGQFTIVPIRPDWNDSSDLLGYRDIKGEFKPGPLTKVIEKAESNPSLPYFLLLDEMNLARVEYYLSDILSVMETRRWQDGQMISSILLSQELVGRKLMLPNNIYIVGTVNMDETTYPFSKKVLDRANTIEFNRVELSNLDFLKEKESLKSIIVSESKFRAEYLHLKDLYVSNNVLVEKVTSVLERINKSLQIANAHVGYRVRDEICFYSAYNEINGFMTFEKAIDFCILQKILPRISGSDSRVNRTLKELFKLLTNIELREDQDNFTEQILSSKYRKSAEKILEMHRRLNDDGFTSFWIS